MISDDPEDILEIFGDVRSGFGGAKTMKEAERAWTHFHSLKSYVEGSSSNDSATMDALDRLESALSTFTTHVRQGMPSLYIGWTIPLSTLQTLVSLKSAPDG